MTWVCSSGLLQDCYKIVIRSLQDRYRIAPGLLQDRYRIITGLHDRYMVTGSLDKSVYLYIVENVSIK